jgi:hypothetical protein
MRTNTQEALLSAYIVSIGKRTPRDAAQDAAELCRFATSLNRLNENRLQHRPHGAARATEAKPANSDQDRAGTRGLGLALTIASADGNAATHPVAIPLKIRDN